MYLASNMNSLYMLPVEYYNTNIILNFDTMCELHLSFPIPHKLTFILIVALASLNEFSFGDDSRKTDSSRTNFEKELSCSVLVGNRMLIFGGLTKTNQVSVVHPWGIHRIQTLPFPFTFGKCMLKNNTIYLCFDTIATQSCRKR